jgi:PhnB protein
MTHVNPYLNFPGNTEEAFNFYKTVFGGEFAMVQRFGPNAGGQPISEKLQNKIMHISLPIGKNNILMGTDACEEMGFSVHTGNNFYICLGPDSREESEKLFNALSAGGTVGMPLQDMFWGAYYGDCTDKYGIRWMINFMPQYAQS